MPINRAQAVPTEGAEPTQAKSSLKQVSVCLLSLFSPHKKFITMGTEKKQTPHEEGFTMVNHR